MSIAADDSRTHTLNAYSLELLRVRYPELEFLFDEVALLRENYHTVTDHDLERTLLEERIADLEYDLRQRDE